MSSYTCRFMYRVAKTYAQLHVLPKEADKEDPHINRSSECRRSVRKVFKQLPSGMESPPCGLNVAKACRMGLPLLEVTFQMLAKEKHPGSPQWLNELMANPHLITYAQADKHPRLMRAYVKSMKHLYNKKGNLILQKGEENATFEEYNSATTKICEMLPETRGNLRGHVACPTLRSGGWNYAIKRLREKNHIPFKMKPSTLPKALKKKGWMNYPKIKVEMHAHYCVAQNILRSQARLARHLLLYISNGKGTLGKKNRHFASVLAIIHKKMTTGFYRVSPADRVKRDYKEFIALVDKHPEYKDLFRDPTADAPEEYLVAIEMGLRNMAANSTTAFGRFALDTRDDWIKVPLWRKRESYIALIRVIEKCGSYLKYVSYHWDDYIMRLKCGQTFMARHAKYTDGTDDTISDLIPDPAAWSDPSLRHERGRKRVRKKKKRVVMTVSPNKESDSSENDLAWDSEEGVFKSQEDIE